MFTKVSLWYTAYSFTKYIFFLVFFKDTIIQSKFIQNLPQRRTNCSFVAIIGKRFTYSDDKLKQSQLNISFHFSVIAHFCWEAGTSIIAEAEVSDKIKK